MSGEQSGHQQHESGGIPQASASNPPASSENPDHSGTQRDAPGTVMAVETPPRRDLTHLPTWTIDCRNPLEIDDAISVEAISTRGRDDVSGDGTTMAKEPAWRVYVHVADPTS